MPDGRTRILHTAALAWLSFAIAGCDSARVEEERGGSRSPAVDAGVTDPSRRMVVTSFAAARAKFAPLDPKRPDGPQIAVLWGDHRKGPSASLFRFPRNYGGPLHIHSADYHLSLLEGTMKHWGGDEREAEALPLGRGAYWFQPRNQVHSDDCLSTYCVAFVKFEGPIDATYVDPPDRLERR